MFVSDQSFQLTDQPGALGLSCRDTGVALAGVPLLHKTAFGFAPRPSVEIGALLKAAYGRDVDASGLVSGLNRAAEALNRGDLGRAMIASLHLRLPDLSWDGAVGIAKVHDVLAKYDPDEPRDARGRWTTGGEGSGPAAPAPPRRKPVAVGAAGRRRNQTPGVAAHAQISPAVPSQVDTDSTASWGGVTHLFGGQLIEVQQGPGIGDNGPPEDAELIPEAEPFFPSPKVPQGWDIRGHSVNGLYYPATRRPKLPNGEPWPVADPEAIRRQLAYKPGKTPWMYLYVPIDKVGPMLLGSSETEDYPQPEGYLKVELIGTPQRTFSGEMETGHALDGIKEALRLAATNEFSTIYFNRSFSMITSRLVQSLIRPDVVARARPELNNPNTYHPYESLSAGQTVEERQEEMPDVPGIARLDGRKYKIYRARPVRRLTAWA